MKQTVVGNSIITDTYAITLPALPDRPDISSEERQRRRKADRIFYSELEKQFGGRANYERAKTLGLPEPIGSAQVGGWNPFGSNLESFWSRTALARWRDEILGLADRLR